MVTIYILREKNNNFTNGSVPTEKGALEIKK